MKKILTLMVAAMLVTGVSYACGDGKKCDAQKSCCKKDTKCKDGKDAKAKETKETKETKDKKSKTVKA